MPVRAKLPIIKQDEVNGIGFIIFPIFRMSCSSPRLWIIDPEHIKSIALKNAWVQICRKARYGWLIPSVTIISPSWLDVEKATIFLISFCVSAQMAVNSVVIAPRHNIIVKILLLFDVRGWNRINKKIPATTIVLEWSKAETGVGPSIADGSHGWRPNWADFPVAAIKRPNSGIKLLSDNIICWNSHEFIFRENQIIARMSPISPMRLYKIACRAAVLASVRPYHHPISRNDIIPTPSHPMNSWNRLLAEVKISIVMRNNRRYLMNRLICRSECIYHEENCIIDHVTNKATDINRIEKKSILKLIESLIEFIVIQCQVVIIYSIL